MADKKISALTAATTPLGGTEVFPIVQSSTTVKATIANVQSAPVSAGTANAVQYLDGSKVPTTGTALTFDGTYALGVGTTLSAWGGNYRAFQAGSTAFFGGNTAVNRNYTSSNVYWNGTNYKYITTSFATQFEQSDGAFYWLQAPSDTAGNNISFVAGMVLDTSGRLLLGTSSAPSDVNSLAIGNIAAGGNPQQGVVITPTGVQVLAHASGTASGTVYSYFNYAGGTVGSISQNGTTGVLYNLTSDYRLKNNPEALTGAKDFVMALQPKKWQWWDGSGEGVGFIAHEFMNVAKHSGNGEKDAVKEEEYEITPAIKDEQGQIVTEAIRGTRVVPVYQTIQPSSSEVMANLVSLLQEQQTIIETLTQRITALEG